MLKPVFKTTVKSKKNNYAEFSLSPLEQGYGHTLGNGLRRALLVSLPGAAITQAKIKGVRHQFTTLPGLKEDVVEFCLNLKQVRFRVKRGEGPFKATLQAKGSGEVKASQIKTPAELTVVNQDLVLGHLVDKKSQLQVELQVETGFGYQLAEKKERKIGFIPLDAAFAPVTRVAYEVKSTRVGRRTDLDGLILKITTDGTIEPRTALEEAAKTLVVHFRHIYQPVFEKEKEAQEEEISPGVKELSVEEIGLPTRIANALLKGGFKTVADLLDKPQEEILKIKNFGEKSFKILARKLKKKGVELEASGEG